MKTALYILIAITRSALATDDLLTLKTTDGKEYRGAKATSVSTDAIRITYEDGVATLPIAALTPESQIPFRAQIEAATAKVQAEADERAAREARFKKLAADVAALRREAGDSEGILNHDELLAAVAKRRREIEEMQHMPNVSRLAYETAIQESDASNPNAAARERASALRTRMLMTLTARFVDAIAKEKADGIQRYLGHVTAHFPGGLLLTGEPFPGPVLLVGFPKPDTAFDGTEIAACVKPIGSFSYKAVDAGEHTVPKLQYVGPAPRVIDYCDK